VGRGGVENGVESPEVNQQNVTVETFFTLAKRFGKQKKDLKSSISSVGGKSSRCKKQTSEKRRRRWVINEKPGQKRLPRRDEKEKEKKGGECFQTLEKELGELKNNFVVNSKQRSQG